MLVERAGVRRLYHRAIGDGVGERKADLDEVRAGLRDDRQEFAREGEVRVARGHERHERLPLRGAQIAEQCINRVHAEGCIRRRGCCPVRYSPRNSREPPAFSQNGFCLYRRGVAFHRESPMVPTPKGLYSAPSRMRLSNPFGVMVSGLSCVPRVREARPWAVECNPFGVELDETMAAPAPIELEACRGSLAH